MAENVQALVAAVEARYSKAEKDMKQFVGMVSKKMKEAEAATKKANAAMERATAQSFGRMSGYVKTFIAGYLSIRSLKAFGGFISESLEAAASIKDVANAAGVSTKFLQEMRFAASQTGADAATLDDALIKLNTRLGDLRTTGAGPASKTLEQLGLSARILSGDLAGSEQTMEAVLAALAKIKDDSDRAALATDLFGKAAGPKLAEFLKAGEGAIAKARAEAHRLGLVLSDELIDKADDASDKLNQLWEQMRTTGVKAVAENADAILELAQAFADGLPDMIDWVRGWGEWLGLVERTPERIEAVLEPLRKAREEMNALATPLVAAALDAKIAGMEWDKFLKTLQGNVDDPWTGEVTVVGKRPTKTAGPPPLLPSSTPRTPTTREPAAREKVTFPDGIGSGFSDALAQGVAESEALKESFRGVFRQAFEQLAAGDFAGAAESFAQAFVQRINDQLSDKLFDFVWDSLGLGDIASSIFGPLDAATVANVASTTQATAATTAFSAGLWAATASANAFAAAAAAGAATGGGGGGGWLGSAISAALGLFGFSKGGYTGPGGTHDPAGIVHKGEVVFSKSDVARHGGPAVVDAMRRGLPGYADGGIVSAAMPRIPSAVNRSSTSIAFSPVINVGGDVSPETVKALRGELDRQRMELQAYAQGEKSRVRSHIGDLRQRRAI